MTPSGTRTIFKAHEDNKRSNYIVTVIGVNSNSNTALRLVIHS